MKKPIKHKFNFKPLGNAIKDNRISKDLTQQDMAGLLDLQLPYYCRIENNGQHPSLQILYELVQSLHISLDEYFLPDKEDTRTSKRRVVDDLLDELSENELEIILGTVKGIQQSKENQKAILTNVSSDKKYR